MLGGMNLTYVESVKYLGVVINAAKSFKYSMKHVRMRCYRVFNSCKNSRSELWIGYSWIDEILLPAVRIVRQLSITIV